MQRKSSATAGDDDVHGCRSPPWRHGHYAHLVTDCHHLDICAAPTTSVISEFFLELPIHRCLAPSWHDFFKTVGFSVCTAALEPREVVEVDALPRGDTGAFHQPIDSLGAWAKT
jgi:hypothetical protein